jgi:hypothetical protein
MSFYKYTGLYLSNVWVNFSCEAHKVWKKDKRLDCVCLLIYIDDLHNEEYELEHIFVNVIVFVNDFPPNIGYKDFQVDTTTAFISKIVELNF